MPYCEGRENSIWVVPPLLPAEIVPLGLLFLTAAIFFFCLVASLIRKCDILVATLFFLGGLVLFAGWFFINNQRLYLFGFTNYARNVLTTEEWRSIARFAQAKMKPDDYLSAFDIMVENGGKRNLWSEFTNHTQIQKLGPGLTISVPAPDRTEIEWGSALVGHRAVLIYSNTNDISPPDDVFSGPLFFAPDIATFIENQ